MSIAVPIRRALSAPPGLRLDQVGPGARRRFATGQGYEHDFTAKPWLPQGFTFTRSGSALAWQGGQYVSKGTNEPRIEDLDYLGLSGRKGLLIEGARTNLITRSHEFDNAAWVKNLSATVTADAAVSPDGASTADEANFPAGGHLSRTCALADGATGTFSCWVKAAPSGSATHVRLSSTNTLAFNTGASTKLALTSSWQRVSITWSNSGSSNIDCIIGAKDAAGSNDAQCIGKVLIWGPQFEVAAFPSSPIPTAGSTATRNAETCSRSVVLPSGGYTDVLEFTAPASFVPGGFQMVSHLDDGSDNNRHLIWIGGNTTISHLTIAGGVTTVNLTVVTPFVPYARYRVARRIQADNTRIAVNGVLSSLDSSCAMPTGITTERLEHERTGAGQWFGHILRCNASPTRWRPPVSDAQLQALSALS